MVTKFKAILGHQNYILLPRTGEVSWGPRNKLSRCALGFIHFYGTGLLPYFSVSYSRDMLGRSFLISALWPPQAKNGRTTIFVQRHQRNTSHHRWKPSWLTCWMWLSTAPWWNLWMTIPEASHKRSHSIPEFWHDYPMTTRPGKHR